MTSSSSKHPSVIVTQEGETIKETDPRVRPELIERVPQHDWRSKAFELVGLATRRRAIIRRLIKQGQWRPIETAPKDGTFVWVWEAGLIRPVVCRFSDRDGWIDEAGEYDYRPTHWMPLPAKNPKSGS